MARTLVAAGIVLAAGVWALYQATLGFQAFTQEAARRVSIRQTPRPIPALSLQRQDGARVTLAELEGQLIVATFIYTNCRSICPLAMARMRGMQAGLDDALSRDELHFLGVSFDPDEDTPERLAAYADHFGVDIEHWWVVRPRSDLEEILRVFGVTVIPVQKGMYVHNAAFYLIDRELRLIDIFDADEPDAVTRAVSNRL